MLKLFQDFIIIRIAIHLGENNLCSFTANLEADLNYIGNVKLSDVFFYNYTLNPITIFGYIVDVMIILLIINQRFLLAKMIQMILLKKLFQSLVIYNLTLKTNKVVSSSFN